MTEISIFRTSFIWVETVPAILQGPPEGRPYGFLGQYGGYAQHFDLCQSGQGAPGMPILPWISPRGNHYWKYYFDGKHAGDTTGVQAWKKLVPFRLELPSRTVTTGAEARVTFEAFYAPQGIAMVALLNYRGKPKSALEVAKLALEVRHEYRFEITGSPGPAAGVNLDQAAERALTIARERGFGKVVGFPGDNHPFSVTTFLVGENVVTPVQGGDEHFLLEAVASWNRTLTQADLAKRPLAQAQLPIRDPSDDNMMYARKQARAIWMAHNFGENPATSVLACYHRNITQASLQTLSLGEFVSWVAAQYDGGEPVALTVKERAKRAATLLELFSDGQAGTGKKVTYRSASIQAQLEDADWTKAIAFVKALPK
jgi:hypothetical protein